MYAVLPISGRASRLLPARSELEEGRLPWTLQADVEPERAMPCRDGDQPLALGLAEPG
jgi:hypothetical protein